MDLFFDWCIDHVDLLIPIAFGLVEFIILIIFRKRVKIQEFVLNDSSFTNRIVDLIKAAESIYGDGHGKEKMDYVLNQMCSNCSPLTRNFTESLVRARVEQVLETPQKKGD